jgi:hypothetical protein
MNYPLYSDVILLRDLLEESLSVGDKAYATRFQIEEMFLDIFDLIATKLTFTFVTSTSIIPIT